MTLAKLLLTPVRFQVVSKQYINKLALSSQSKDTCFDLKVPAEYKRNDFYGEEFKTSSLLESPPYKTGTPPPPEPEGTWDQRLVYPLKRTWDLRLGSDLGPDTHVNRQTTVNT